MERRRPPNPVAGRPFAGPGGAARTLLRLVLGLVALCAAQGAPALDPERPFEDYSLRQWQLAEGLPNLSAYAITQDADGFLWVTWTTGIARFDGTRFQTIPRRETGLAGTDVRNAYRDRDGRLWFGSIHGLLLYEKGAFRSVPGAESGVMAGVVELEDGSIVAATTTGARRFDGERLVAFGVPGFDARSIVRTPRGFVLGGAGAVQVVDDQGARTIALPAPFEGFRVEHLAASGDTVWLGTSQGLLTLREGSIEAVRLVEDGVEHGPEQPDLARAHIMALHVDRAGNLWISTTPRLVRVRPDGRVERVDDESLARTPYIIEMFEDRDGTLWFGTRYQGLFAAWDGWARRLDSRKGLHDPVVWSLLEDPSGGVLLGTNTDVVRVHDGRLARRIDANSLGNRSAFELAFDTAGRLWVGTRVGLAVFDGAREATPGGLGAFQREQVFLLQPRADGGMWIGTAVGLYLYRDGRTEAIGPPGDIGAGSSIRALVDHDGGLLVGTAAGLLAWREGRWSMPPWAQPLSEANISAFTRLDDERLLIATRDLGLGIVGGGRLRLLGSEDGLPGDNAWHAEVLDGWVYVASADGVWRMRVADLPDPRVAADGPLPIQRVLSREECCTSGGHARVARDGRSLWFAGTRGAIQVEVDAIDPAVRRPVAPVIEGLHHGDRLHPPSAVAEIAGGARDVELQFTAVEFRDPRRLHFRYRLVGHDAQWRDAGERRRIAYTNLAPGQYAFEVALAEGAAGEGPVARMPFSIAPRWHETVAFRAAVPLAVFGLFLLLLFGVRQFYDRRRRVLQSLVDERTAELSAAHARERDANAKLRAEVEERLAAERALTQRNAELEALNVQIESAQTQLLQSEKMASVGQLAAGVAHEINNPIGFVQSNLNVLGQYVEDLAALATAYEAQLAPREREAARASLPDVDLAFIVDDLPQLIGQSKEGVARVVKIVRDLRDFSYVDRPEWQEVDLHDCLESTLNLVSHELKYKATVERRYATLPKITCMPFQINQVIMNLLINAVQAIPERGSITLATAVEGDGVRVEISDDGKGIPVDIIGRIFEPFFTTKPIGTGTGLGLSVSYGIVRKHGGTIEATSTEGEGTTFTIRLPVVPPAAGSPGDDVLR
jgi:signal transduction histidine kinase/ligand-binding sensor domain-containing protein